LTAFYPPGAEDVPIKGGAPATKKQAEPGVTEPYMPPGPFILLLGDTVIGAALSYDKNTLAYAISGPHSVPFRQTTPAILIHTKNPLARGRSRIKNRIFNKKFLLFLWLVVKFPSENLKKPDRRRAKTLVFESKTKSRG
jgi:hypothetical protein